jgi:4-hydroxy-tetrahydrodipicolinate reductase
MELKSELARMRGCNFIINIREAPSQMIKVCLLGLGKTGAVVAEQLSKSQEFDLVSVISKSGSPKIGRTIGEVIGGDQDLVIEDAKNLNQEIEEKQFQVAVDFTSPEASMNYARIFAEKGISMVIGTTGFNTLQIYELKKLAQQSKVGIVYAPNISVGVNLLLSIAKILARFIPHYDVEITEHCHRGKKDAPSGTALKIADEISAIKGPFHTKAYTYGRKGTKLRSKGEIGIHSIRAGGNAGVHQVLFAGESDEIEIIHRSYSRAIYAEGALKAAAFIAGRQGYYQMEEVLMADQRMNLNSQTPPRLKFNLRF